MSEPSSPSACGQSGQGGRDTLHSRLQIKRITAIFFIALYSSDFKSVEHHCKRPWRHSKRGYCWSLSGSCGWYRSNTHLQSGLGYCDSCDDHRSIPPNSPREVAFVYIKRGIVTAWAFRGVLYGLRPSDSKSFINNPTMNVAILKGRTVSID
jgi:hypothetical protein